MFKKLFNNEAGVSPIVATLVLVVVAIAGAAAVGTIMGSFSSDVSDQASASNTKDVSSTELLLDGSSTVYPVSVLLAEGYMKENTGVRVDVTSSSSGTGIAATGMDLVDIGAASKALPAEDAEKYPDIQVHQIGASAVVMVFNNASACTNFNITASQAAAIYNNASNEKVTLAAATHGLGSTETVTVIKRDGDSGTQDTFCDYVGIDDAKMEGDDIEAKAMDGNAAVAAYVATTPGTIAFLDYGFAVDNKLNIVGIDCGYNEVTEDNVVLAINGETSAFPSGLTRPLNYMTNGNPSTVEQSFIDFAMNPANSDLFAECGYFAMIDLA